MSREMTLEEIRKQAEESWTPCHGCDQYDKEMWINGFVTGYLNGQQEDTVIKRKDIYPKTEQ